MTKFANSAYIGRLLGAFLLSGLFNMAIMPATAHEGATGIIKERMDKFSEARQQMRQMRQALSDTAKIAEISQSMLPWAQEMENAFPAGSDGAPSEASPQIWTDREGFASKITAYHEAILTLNEAALSGDETATIAAYQALGASCKSCHRSYRQ